MSDLKIITNKQARPILGWEDMNEKEQSNFDYLDTDDKKFDAKFFRYRGWVYDVGEFLSLSHTNNVVGADSFKGWDGYASDSFYSGVLIKFTNDNESVIVGRYYS